MTQSHRLMKPENELIVLGIVTSASPGLVCMLLCQNIGIHIKYFNKAYRCICVTMDINGEE